LLWISSSLFHACKGSSNEESAKDPPKDGFKLNGEVICSLSRVWKRFTSRTEGPQSTNEGFSPSNFTAYIALDMPQFHEMNNEDAYGTTESF